MATITTIDASDLITDSRADINNNFSNLNTDKMETSVLDTDNTLAANSDTKIPSQKAVKAYVDTGGNVNASTTDKGIVEEATQAEYDARTATGATGARLFVNPSTIPTTNPVINTYTSSGTWTKPAGLKYVVVEVIGGGGAGSGSDDNAYSGAGGGAGGYSKEIIPTASLGATESYVVGTATVTSSFGTSPFLQATGGANAGGPEASGAGGVGSSGTINVAGQGGSRGMIAPSSQGGVGGSSVLGGGGNGGEAASGAGGAGVAGGAYGAGGGGGGCSNGSQNANGGAGATGVVIVTEYYS